MPYANLPRSKIAVQPPREWLDNPECIPLTMEEARRWGSFPKAGQGLDLGCAGKEVHVLGTGPSLARYPNKPAIRVGVNGVPHSVECNYWLVADRMDVPGRTLCDWMRRFAWSMPRTRQVLKGSSALTCLAGSPPSWHPDAIWEGSVNLTVKGDSCLFMASSSVHPAVDLVRRSGASRIILWGVDLTDHSHHYSGDLVLEADPMNMPGREFPFLATVIEGFRKLNERCQLDGVELVVANPESALVTMLGIPCPKGHSMVASPGIPKAIPEAAQDRFKPPQKVSRPVMLRCHYTPDYQDKAAICVETFEAHGLDVVAVPMRPGTSWIKTCMQRQFDLNQVAQIANDRWVGLLDADTRCVGVPSLFLDPPTGVDVMVHDRGEDQPDEHRYCASSVCFAPTPKGRSCLAEWARLCETDPLAKKKIPCREQSYLKMAIESIVGLDLFDLGREYNCKPEHGSTATVIMHDVASRQTLGRSAALRQ